MIPKHTMTLSPRHMPDALVGILTLTIPAGSVDPQLGQAPSGIAPCLTLQEVDAAMEAQVIWK